VCRAAVDPARRALIRSVSITFPSEGGKPGLTARPGVAIRRRGWETPRRPDRAVPPAQVGRNGPWSSGRRRRRPAEPLPAEAYRQQRGKPTAAFAW